MRIPGPSSLFAAADSLREGVTDLVFDLPGTVNEVLELLRRTTELVDRADVLLARAEGMVDRGEAALSATENMLRDGEAMLDRTAGLLADAEDSAAAAAGLTARADALLAPLEELSETAMPVASEVMESFDPDEVQAVIGMVNHLPQLLEHLESDIMPMLGRLDQVGPDVHDILDGVSSITSALSGLPGVSILIRRGVDRKNRGEGLSHEQAHQYARANDERHRLPSQVQDRTPR